MMAAALEAEARGLWLLPRGRTASLPTKIIHAKITPAKIIPAKIIPATKIRWLEISVIFSLDMKTPPLQIQILLILLESNPLRFRIEAAGALSVRADHTPGAMQHGMVHMCVRKYMIYDYIAI